MFFDGIVWVCNGWDVVAAGSDQDAGGEEAGEEEAESAINAGKQSGDVGVRLRVEARV